jgi:hypothetical protein
MATAKAKASEASILDIVIPKPKSRILELTLEGVSPLIIHNWDQKGIAQIRAKQGQKAQAKRGARDPEAEFNAARYRMGKFDGIPAVTPKAAAVAACRFVQGLTMTQCKGLFHVNPGEELIRIVTPTPPKMREDVVRLESGVADLRYRPMYDPWSLNLRVRYDETLISAQQIVHLFMLAGENVGIGEWRTLPKKGNSGPFGMFQVESKSK